MLALLLALGCTTGAVEIPPTCALEAPVLASTEAVAPGTALVVTTSPLTTLWDTQATVGDQRARVLAVTREACDACDSCLEDNACTRCGLTCAACTDSCGTCAETVTVEVPALRAGRWPLVIRNGIGTSLAVDIDVAGPSDTGSSDTGASDTAR